MKGFNEKISTEKVESNIASWIHKRIDVIKNDADKLKNYTDRAIYFIWPEEGELIESEKIARVVLEIIHKELIPNADLSELDPEKVAEFINMIDDIITSKGQDDSLLKNQDEEVVKTNLDQAA